MIIYKITNLINNKVYVGKDTKDDPNYFGSGYLIKLAIKKYGKQNFKKETLAICHSIEDLNLQEIFWINKLNSTDLKIGYNIALGGSGGDTISNNPNKDIISKNISISNKGRKFSDEHKRKISDAKKSIPTKNGWNHTEESKIKMKDAWKNRNPVSEETKIKMSIAHKGNSNGKGYKHTEEAKLKMKAAKMKYLIPVTIDNITYESISDARRCTGLSYAKIKNLLKK